jgi:uncharacterized protein YkwD
MTHTLLARLGLALAAVTALAGLSLADNPEVWRRPVPPPPHRPIYLSRATLIFQAVNNERQKAGLPALQYDSRLGNAAVGHAQNMAQQNVLSHFLNGKGPGDRISAAGYSWSSYGECIGWNYGSAAAVVAGWMADPPHRAIVLNPNFTQGAAGSAVNAQKQPYDCMDFARPL